METREAMAGKVTGASLLMYLTFEDGSETTIEMQSTDVSKRRPGGLSELCAKVNQGADRIARLVASVENGRAARSVQAPAPAPKPTKPTRPDHPAMSEMENRVPGSRAAWRALSSALTALRRSGPMDLNAFAAKVRAHPIWAQRDIAPPSISAIEGVATGRWCWSTKKGRYNAYISNASKLRCLQIAGDLISSAAAKAEG